jgi:hypothetical protein
MHLAIRQDFDLAADTLDPLVQPEPVLVEADDDVVQAFGILITPYPLMG